MANLVVLAGHLGAKPEIRDFEGGGKVANVNIATNERWTDREGVRQERTDWHRLVFHNGLAGVVEKHLDKGSRIYIEGQLRTREYQDQGQTRYITEVHVDEMEMMDGPRNAAQAPADAGSVAGAGSSVDAGDPPV
jgi:single-strand DNA-binding protein